ncbi:MAG: hypothetical protein II026_09325 [Bacteroidales bacterium]|nr:hypothetical protein [Bacteroidales bacterium]
MKRFLITLMAAAACCSGLFAQDIDSLVANMSRREKIAQLIIEAIDSRESPELRARQEQWIREGLGGLIVMDDKLCDNIQMINELQSLARIPMIVSIDGEWGAAMRFYEYAAFPRAMQLGALDDEVLVEQAGRAIGEELRQIKIFANYAPVIDINNNPKNPVINTRSFGEDRERVSRLGAAYMRGMQGAGVWGSAKHFPGHGDTDVDSHKGLPVLTFGRSRLDSLELYPYRRLIDEGVAMIMVGHLSIPALDSTGTPASISKPIVTGLLRGEMGYKGIIITDALGMKGVAEGNANAALLAYKAGADILLMPQDTRQTIDELDAAFRSGELDEADLDTRVRRVLGLKQRSGMLAPGYSPYVDTTGLTTKARRPETESLIQTLCDRSMTVVKGKLRRPLRLRGTKPRVAYVAFNAVSPESACFEEELTKAGRVARFDLPGDATPQQIDSVGALLKGYRKVIVGFHSGKPRPRSGGPQRFASVEEAQFVRIAGWARRHKLYGFYLGNPYDLDKLPGFNRFRTFIIGYSDTRYNNIAAARALTVRGSARGSLPVGAAGLPAGFHSNRIKNQSR